MKRRIIIEIVSGALIFIIGISVGNFYAMKNVDKKVSAVASQSTTISKEAAASNKDKPKPEAPATEIKLNEPFQVKTEYGNYNFTIKSVTKTDWWEREHDNKDKTVILLNLECENISFKSDNHGIELYDAFKVKDNNSYLLPKSSTGYGNENDGLTDVSVNTKSRISMPYIVENNATSVSVEFNRGGILKNIPITS